MCVMKRPGLLSVARGSPFFVSGRAKTDNSVTSSRLTISRISPPQRTSRERKLDGFSRTVFIIGLSAGASRMLTGTCELQAETSRPQSRYNGRKQNLIKCSIWEKQYRSNA